MNFKCEKCEKLFKDNFNLRRHLNRQKPCVKKQTDKPIKQNITIINNYINQCDSEKSEQEHRELLKRLVNVLK
jgi:hypothetical protein